MRDAVGYDKESLDFGKSFELLSGELAVES